MVARPVGGLKHGKDMTTYNLAWSILEQKVEYEEDLRGLIEDVDLMVSRGAK